MKSLLITLIFAVVSAAPSLADSLDQHARAKELVVPTFPSSEKLAGRGGIATIVVRVDAKGIAIVEQVMGTLHPFIVAAKSAAQSWRFEPARRDGRLAPDVLEFVVVFDAKKGVEILGPLYRG